MSIVSSYATPEAESELKRQRRVASVLSLIIAILSVVLVGVVLAFILFPSLILNPAPLVSYSVQAPEEEVVEQRELVPQVQRQPSAPSSAMTRVIASTTPSPTAVPVPEVDVPEPSLDFGTGDDFGAGWGSGSGFGAGGTSFFGQSVKAERIAYVIDFSKSMAGKGKGSREDLMRQELTDSILQLSSKTDYALVFFAGPAWVAGDDVDWNKQGAIVTGKGGHKFRWKSQGKAHDWEHSGKKEPVEWLEATNGQIAKSKRIIQDTRLVWGTRWDNPLNMALDMSPPPQAIYFMTDGVASGSSKWAEEVGARAAKAGIIVNCIAMMEPRAHQDMDLLAKKTGGQFTIVMKDGTRKKVR